ncbi:MAG: alpha/beta hydrolase [Leptospiraceae bacterium]|nr:alpha/beta hydrolase [Leptospiraceae bacterium]
MKESEENEKPIKKKSAWKDFTNSLKKAADTTGTGLKYVFDKGNEHKHYLVPAWNGLFGDKLAELKDKRAIQMNFRRKGEDVPVKDLNLIDELKKHNGTLILFIHGLMADEVLWEEPSVGKLGYAPRLARDLNAVSLCVRYNTGMHISQNGRAISNLFQELVDTYGKDIKDLIIVAHSMGGLVTRSSGYYATLQNQNWIKKLSRVVLIGVPNDGSFLEKFGHLTTFVLKNIWNFHTKLIAKIADERSNGIKDLRWGFMVDEDWQDKKADALINVKKTDVAPLPNVKYYIVTGTLSENPESIVSSYFGDGLVGHGSASGKMFYGIKESEENNLEFKPFPETNHVALLTDDSVYDYILSVLNKV